MSDPNAPARVAPGTGPTNVNVARQYVVRSLEFQHGYDIWYARIPDNRPNVGWVSPPPDQPAAKLILPPAVFPVSGTPHYQTQPNGAPSSWPVAYVRSGGNQSGARTLHVRFECVGFASTDTFEVTGTTAGTMRTDAQTITFSAGTAEATFTLDQLPATVSRLSQYTITWSFRRAGNSAVEASCVSQHTFFILDAEPLRALGGVARQDLRYGSALLNRMRADAAARGQPQPTEVPDLPREQAYFELYDWSCLWSQGQTGPEDIIRAMWTKFSPINDPHPSGLSYWKNFSQGGPAQSIAAAIRRFDPVYGPVQYAASCVCWDRMFLNGLALQGIGTSEVLLESPYTFMRSSGRAPPYLIDGTLYNRSLRWWIPNAAAQGNAAAAHPTPQNGAGPDQWSNHWIADIFHSGSWHLYDPSYGVTMAWGPSPNPQGYIVPPAAYETGVTYHSAPAAGGNEVVFTSRNPADPKLVGTVLDANGPTPGSSDADHAAPATGGGGGGLSTGAIVAIVAASVIAAGLIGLGIYEIYNATHNPTPHH